MAACVCEEVNEEKEEEIFIWNVLIRKASSVQAEGERGSVHGERGGKVGRRETTAFITTAIQALHKLGASQEACLLL